VRLPSARSAATGGKSQSCVSVHSRHILTNRTVIRDSKGRGADASRPPCIRARRFGTFRVPKRWRPHGRRRKSIHPSALIAERNQSRGVRCAGTS
jgi:hypothetical protein